MSDERDPVNPTAQADDTWPIRRNPYPEVLPEPAPEPEPDAGKLGKLKKDELVALAEAQGVDADGTKAELVERLTAEPE